MLSRGSTSGPRKYNNATKVKLNNILMQKCDNSKCEKVTIKNAKINIHEGTEMCL
jgi:hypothetical protein